jgi:hypothetical protein
VRRAEHARGRKEAEMGKTNSLVSPWTPCPNDHKLQTALIALGEKLLTRERPAEALSRDLLMVERPPETEVGPDVGTAAKDAARRLAQLTLADAGGTALGLWRRPSPPTARREGDGRLYTWPSHAQQNPPARRMRRQQHLSRARKKSAEDRKKYLNTSIERVATFLIGKFSLEELATKPDTELALLLGKEFKGSSSTLRGRVRKCREQGLLPAKGKKAQKMSGVTHIVPMWRSSPAKYVRRTAGRGWLDQMGVHAVPMASQLQ